MMELLFTGALAFMGLLSLTVGNYMLGIETGLLGFIAGILAHIGMFAYVYMAIGFDGLTLLESVAMLGFYFMVTIPVVGLAVIVITLALYVAFGPFVYLAEIAYEQIEKVREGKTA